MSVRVDVEEIQTTKGEKFLAYVLAVFLLIGGIWTYQKIDDYVAEAIELNATAPGKQVAIERLEAAQRRHSQARGRERAALENLELRREAYRTALDAGRSAAALERGYRAASREYERAQEEQRRALQEVRAALPAAREASRLSEAEIKRRIDRRDLFTVLIRLGFVAAALAFGYWFLARLRSRGSRYYPLGFAVVGFASVLALVMAGDYITDYVEPFDLGPLVLSLFGVAMTVVAFVALQRYLARRLPVRRVRKQECPFCGYPVRGAAHCEGCGRQVTGECARCSGPRRVGTQHCAVCGAS